MRNCCRGAMPVFALDSTRFVERNVDRVRVGEQTFELVLGGDDAGFEYAAVQLARMYCRIRARCRACSRSYCRR